MREEGTYTGKQVFYPMGWDDNGLPTERRVQNYYGVRCDPSMPYDPDFTPPAKPSTPSARCPSAAATSSSCATSSPSGRRAGLRGPVAPSRACRSTGRITYTTIDEAQRVASGRSCATWRGEAYQSEAPTMWDVTFQTAVAQAELEAASTPAPTTASPSTARRGPVYIETTRPELLPSLRGPDRPPRRRALPSRCSAPPSPRRCSASRSRCCPPGRRDGQGRRHRDVLHLR
jgi:valyl-tRNA synthetase